jgi:hypothetical protein
MTHKPTNLSLIYNEHPMTHESFGKRQIEMMPLHTLQKHPMGRMIRGFANFFDEETGHRNWQIAGRSGISDPQLDHDAKKLYLPAADSAASIVRQLHGIYCTGRLLNFSNELSPAGNWMMEDLIKNGSRTWRNLVDRPRLHDEQTFEQKADSVFTNLLVSQQPYWGSKIREYSKEPYSSNSLARDTAILTGPVLDIVTHIPGTKKSFLLSQGPIDMVELALQKIYLRQPVSKKNLEPVNNVIQLWPFQITVERKKQPPAPEPPI